MSRFLLSVVVLLLFGSCAKKEVISYVRDQNLSSIEVINLEGGTATYINDVIYDDQGKLIKLGDEEYTYDTNGKLVQVTQTIRGDRIFTHYLTYDHSGRQARIVWDNKSDDHVWDGGRRDRIYEYMGDSSAPSLIRLNYIDDLRFYLYSSFTGNIRSNTITLNEENENIKLATSVIVFEPDRWGVEPRQMYVEYNFEYDEKPNVFKALFPDMEWMPAVFTEIGGFTFHHCLNTNNLRSEQRTVDKYRSPITEFYYEYDQKGRIESIRTDRLLYKFYY